MKFLAAILFAIALTAHAALTPGELKCEYRTNPLGIDAAQPRLFWQFASAERGARQTAYQILAASSAKELATDHGDLWDSGKVVSDETIQIPYAGVELKSSQSVFWKVRTWDSADKPSVWSAPATWTMGVLKSNDWTAKWIIAPAATEALLLRKEFSVKPGLVRALVHVTGLGQYELRANGAKCGDQFLAPGWTDYADTVLYDTLDVTTQLRAGANALGISLGNGMYNVVRRNRFVKFTGSFGPLRALCQLELDYADGSREVVGSDESWRVTAGPMIFSSIYGGEDFDARLNPIGWDKPGFDDSLWRNAVTLVRPQGKLRGACGAAMPLKEIEVHTPVAQRALADGQIVFDLGQNASHIPRLRVTGPRGSSVRIIPSEVVNADGSINQSTMGAGKRGSSWWEFTKGTDGEEEWQPQFCYIGCRYLQAKLLPAQTNGALPEIKSLAGVVVHSSAAPVGDFECSNDLLNRTRTLVRWAQRANLVSVLTDCPHREKLGWLEQYHLNGPSLRYEFDLAQLFTKGMNDMADAQEKNGFVPTIAPEYTKFEGSFRAATEWNSSFVIVPWQQYLFAADVQLFRTHYRAMTNYFHYLETRADAKGIVSEGLGDWYDLIPGRKPGFAALTLPPFTATAFYQHDAWIMSQVAALLGHTNDAQNFSRKAEKIRTDFNHAFYLADRGCYTNDTQCANALALVLNLCEPANRDRVLASLVRGMETNGYAITAGDVGFRFLLQALAQGGRSDVIYKMINQDATPGYGYQLKKGATSLTEAWDANTSASHNHFMLGQVTEWFYQNLVGIAADASAPGFKHILIQPQPVGDLRWARASYASVRGQISARWQHDAGKFTLSVTIPANTTATVFLPANSVQSVTENGKPVTQARGVKFLREEKGRAIFEIESGAYEFASAWE